jgi:hypothetical protein
MVRLGEMYGLVLEKTLLVTRLRTLAHYELRVSTDQ